MRLVAALLAGAAALGCSGNGAVNPLGAGGSNGGGGNGGTGGAGGNPGDPTFIPVAPCLTEASYATGVTSIIFSGPIAGNSYNPACLKVAVGTNVFFSGDFGNHPLAPSTARGMLTGNPITVTSAGSTVGFTFANPGFWAYYCQVHGSDPDGQDMAGVVWVSSAL